jgi:hypothetical protein
MPRVAAFLTALIASAFFNVSQVEGVSLGTACKIENARYQQRFTPSITARFRDVESGTEWPSKVALLIHTGNTNRSYWWLPWAGGSDGQQNLASTTDVIAPGWRPPASDGGPRPLGDVTWR